MKRRIQCLLLSILILLGTFSSSSLGADEPAVSNSIQVGDFLTLGTFDGQPLLWFVVEKNAEKLKLFCAKELFQGQIDASMHEVLAYADLVGGAWEGDSNWHTSDIRTYLNSNEVSVSYKGADKNELPNYASRPGFLTQFTTDELSLVSETTHKSHIQYHRTNKEHDGGTKCAKMPFYTNIIDFDEEAYENLAYVYTNERFFLPDAMDFRKACKALGDKKIFDSETGLYYDYNLWSSAWLREPVVYGTDYLFWGMFFLDTWSSDYAGYATFERGIRPMCYIDLDDGHKLTGSGTRRSPYSLVAVGESDDPQFISRTPEPDHYLIDGTFKESPTITMKFNREVESVQAGGSSGDFKVVKGTYDETVYSLAAGNHAVTDVSIDGKTVSIHLSDANLLIGEKYSILMDYDVVKFKNTDKKIGVGGTSWMFRYSPLDDGNGFTLRKNNNHFLNDNKTGQVEPYDDLMGFIGVDSYALPVEYYNTLMWYASNAVERSKITYTILGLDWSGNCHGISSTMLLALEGKLNLSQFENGVSQYYDMPNPYKNKNFLNLIQYFHVGQQIENRRIMGGDQIPHALGSLIATLNTEPVLLSIFGAGWGHAILALDYKVNTQGNYTVLLYDMNSFYAYDTASYDYSFTRMDIAKDFKTFALYDNRGKQVNINRIGYTTLEDINRINPFAPAASTVQTQSQEATAASDCVDITVPLSAVSYRIQNAEGQTLICDENGNFSGTMEILDQSGFISGAADGSGSSWTLTVPASERFEVETEQSGINVGIYTEQGCLVLESEDIRSATFVTNLFIRFGQEGQQKFTCVLSNDLPEDQTVRMAYAAAETTGSTQIGLEAGDLLISADKTTLEEAARYVGLEKTELDNISTDDGVIYVPVFSDTEDNDQKITVSLGSMTTVLSAKHALTGQICVAGYRENGQLCSVKFYPAAEKITASVDPGAIRAKVFWLDSSRPVCAAKTIMM